MQIPFLKKKKEIETPSKIRKKEEILFKINKIPEIIQIPELKDKTKIDVEYSLIEPYAKVHIHWDFQNNELVYEVIEPSLNDAERKNLDILEEAVKELINISLVNIKDEETIIEYMEKNLKVLIHELQLKITKDSFKKFMYYLYRDFVGLNQIEPLMRDYYIEDIECNGSKSPLYIVHRKYKNIRTNITFPNNEVLGSFVEKLAQKAGKYVSYANPILDGTLPDSSRVNATYTQDISSKGPTFTIRKFTSTPWTPIKLIDFRTVSPEILAYIWLLIEYDANIMVIGGTASGKTSFLNAIGFFIPPQARIVSIEETKEINLMHENWLPSIARAGIGLANILGQKHGEVSLFDLLKGSFRQRPDYVIVGEIRGKEAYVLFQGAGSGHPIMSTMHAEDVDTMVRRLETNPINLAPSLINSLDVVCSMIQTKVDGKNVRRLKEVSEIIRVGEDMAEINTPFVRDPRTDKFYFKTDSRVFDKLARTHGLTKEELMNEFAIRARLLMEMYKRKIFGFKQVQSVISAYYKNPAFVLKKFNLI